MWTIDFLNMLLGNSADHDAFHLILVKRTATYFKYSETELRQFDISPTALYFAFLDLTNLIEKGLSTTHRTHQPGQHAILPSGSTVIGSEVVNIPTSAEVYQEHID